MYQGYKKRRTIVMETVVFEHTWIRHWFIGCPGTHNDLNVLQQSPLVLSVTRGTFPPRELPLTVNSRTRTLL